MKGMKQAMFRIAFLIFFFTHPHVFHILRVDVWIVWIDKMVRVVHLGMHINAIVDVLYVGICSPHITDNVAPREDAFFYEALQSVSFSIWYLHCKAFPRPPLNTSKIPMVETYNTVMVLSMKK